MRNEATEAVSASLTCSEPKESAWMAVISLTMGVFGLLTVVAVLLSLWGMLATAAPTGWWTWIARTLPEDAEVGGGLMVAVIQLSIALGSTAGGLIFDSLGWQSAFGLSGLLLLGAVAMTFLIFRQDCNTR